MGLVEMDENSGRQITKEPKTCLQGQARPWQSPSFLQHGNGSNQ